jgi:hypothetical protein
VQNFTLVPKVFFKKKQIWSFFVFTSQSQNFIFIMFRFITVQRREKKSSKNIKEIKIFEWSHCKRSNLDVNWFALKRRVHLRWFCPSNMLEKSRSRLINFFIRFNLRF